MAEKGNLKRLTRVDVVAVLAVCALVSLIVLPVFSGSRERSIRMVCKANLSQIGKAMLIYTGDYEGAFPRAGGPSTVWGQTANWMAPDRYAAFGLSRADAAGGMATITASLYLLVRHLELPPRVFLCRGDAGAKEFTLSEHSYVPPAFELTDAWDFGPSVSSMHCSYAYHIPYDPCALTINRDPNFAVAADRNPWIISPAAAPGDFSLFRPDIPPWDGSTEHARAGNAIAHQRDGQNVLFLDGRVSFETRSYYGVEEDNIYTVSMGSWGEPLGIAPVPQPYLRAAGPQDSLLVHDPDTMGGRAPPSGRR